jgi:hypothetical protein
MRCGRALGNSNHIISPGPTQPRDMRSDELRSSVSLAHPACMAAKHGCAPPAKPHLIGVYLPVVIFVAGLSLACGRTKRPMTSFAKRSRAKSRHWHQAHDFEFTPPRARMPKATAAGAANREPCGRVRTTAGELRMRQAWRAPHNEPTPDIPCDRRSRIRGDASRACALPRHA